jgi:hypothetical protein
MRNGQRVQLTSADTRAAAATAALFGELQTSAERGDHGVFLGRVVVRRRRRFVARTRLRASSERRKRSRRGRRHVDRVGRDACARVRLEQARCVRLRPDRSRWRTAHCDPVHAARAAGAVRSPAALAGGGWRHSRWTRARPTSRRARTRRADAAPALTSAPANASSAKPPPKHAVITKRALRRAFGLSSAAVGELARIERAVTPERHVVLGGRLAHVPVRRDEHDRGVPRGAPAAPAAAPTRLVASAGASTFRPGTRKRASRSGRGSRSRAQLGTQALVGVALGREAAGSSTCTARTPGPPANSTAPGAHRARPRAATKSARSCSSCTWVKRSGRRHHPRRANAARRAVRGPRPRRSRRPDSCSARIGGDHSRSCPTAPTSSVAAARVAEPTQVANRLPHGDPRPARTAALRVHARPSPPPVSSRARQPGPWGLRISSLRMHAIPLRVTRALPRFVPLSASELAQAEPSTVGVPGRRPRGTGARGRGCAAGPRPRERTARPLRRQKWPPRQPTITARAVRGDGTLLDVWLGRDTSRRVGAPPVAGVFVYGTLMHGEERESAILGVLLDPLPRSTAG